MIDTDRFPDPLNVLQRLIIAAKSRAYERGASDVAELLNDIELLPQHISDGEDRTDEFADALQGILQVHPDCQFAIEHSSQENVTTN